MKRLFSNSSFISQLFGTRARIAYFTYKKCIRQLDHATGTNNRWKTNSYYPILNPAYINIHDHCLSRYYICCRIYAIEHLLFIALIVLIKPRVVSLLGISQTPNTL